MQQHSNCEEPSSLWSATRCKRKASSLDPFSGEQLGNQTRSKKLHRSSSPYNQPPSTLVFRSKRNAKSVADTAELYPCKKRDVDMYSGSFDVNPPPSSTSSVESQFYSQPPSFRVSPSLESPVDGSGTKFSPAVSESEKCSAIDDNCQDTSRNEIRDMNSNDQIVLYRPAPPFAFPGDLPNVLRRSFSSSELAEMQRKLITSAIEAEIPRSLRVSPHLVRWRFDSTLNDVNSDIEQQHRNAQRCSSNNHENSGVKQGGEDVMIDGDDDMNII